MTDPDIPIGSTWRSRRDTWRPPVTVLRITRNWDGHPVVAYATVNGSINNAGADYFLRNRERIA